MRLIDADVLKEMLKTDCSWELFDDWGNYKPEGKAIMNAIDRCPTAEPCKKGKWDEQSCVWKCSECGIAFDLYFAKEGNSRDVKFCPCCGSYNGGEE